MVRFNVRTTNAAGYVYMSQPIYIAQLGCCAQRVNILQCSFVVCGLKFIIIQLFLFYHEVKRSEGQDTCLVVRVQRQAVMVQEMSMVCCRLTTLDLAVPYFVVRNKNIRFDAEYLFPCCTQYSIMFQSSSEGLHSRGLP